MRRAPKLRNLTVASLAIGLAMLPATAAFATPPPSPTFGPAIDAYGRYEKPTQCLNVEQPGVQDLRSMLQRAYGANSAGIARKCGSGGASSDHNEGRAYDWMLNAGSAADRAKADELLTWLLATDEHGNPHARARRLGINYIVWNRQVWKAYQPSAGWQPYSGYSPHTDHIHFSFTWAGAKRQTTWWTAGSTAAPAPAPAPASSAKPASWRLVNGFDASQAGGAFAFGEVGGGAVSLTGDWDGDGVDTVGWFKDGVWSLRNSNSAGSADMVLNYGRAGDTPVAGDWNGDGRDTVGVVRGKTWILRRTYNRGDDLILDYGRETDEFVAGDWNGDGRDTVGVVRGNKFILRRTYNRGDDVIMTYGRDSDIPVTGDWNGDGIDTLGVVRDNRWILRYVYRSGADIVVDFGTSSMTPVTGDWNDDGIDTVGSATPN